MTSEDGKYHPEVVFSKDDLLYRAINPHHIDGLKVLSAAFQNASGTDSMSVDWNRLSTPEQTAARSVDKGPGRGVASLRVKNYSDEGQVIKHAPQVGRDGHWNPAHSEVVGRKGNGMRKRFAKACDLVLRVDPATQ